MPYKYRPNYYPSANTVGKILIAITAICVFIWLLTPVSAQKDRPCKGRKCPTPTPTRTPTPTPTWTPNPTPTPTATPEPTPTDTPTPEPTPEPTPFPSPDPTPPPMGSISYKLAPFSPYKGMGTDGKDPGVDWDELMYRTRNVQSGKDYVQQP